jgi:hypothetical protein
MNITERDKGIWRAAITLSNNICVDESNRRNADDELSEAYALTDCAKRVRGWVEPTDDQLAEMFTEAEVKDDASAAKCAELESQFAAESDRRKEVNGQYGELEKIERKAFYERQDALQSLELVKAQVKELADALEKSKIENAFMSVKIEASDSILRAVQDAQAALAKLNRGNQT